MIALICGHAIVQCTDPRLAPCDAFLGQTQVLNRFRKGGIDGKRLLEAGRGSGVVLLHEKETPKRLYSGSGSSNYCLDVPIAGLKGVRAVAVADRVSRDR